MSLANLLIWLCLFDPEEFGVLGTFWIRAAGLGRAADLGRAAGLVHVPLFRRRIISTAAPRIVDVVAGDTSPPACVVEVSGVSLVKFSGTL